MYSNNSVTANICSSYRLANRQSVYVSGSETDLSKFVIDNSKTQPRNILKKIPK